MVFDCVTIKALIDGLWREQAHVLDFKSPERHMLSCTGGENKFHGASGFDRYTPKVSRLKCLVLTHPRRGTATAGDLLVNRRRPL